MGATKTHVNGRQRKDKEPGKDQDGLASQQARDTKGFWEGQGRVEMPLESLEIWDCRTHQNRQPLAFG